jgi:hypothetical protein
MSDAIPSRQSNRCLYRRHLQTAFVVAAMPDRRREYLTASYGARSAVNSPGLEERDRPPSRDRSAGRICKDGSCCGSGRRDYAIDPLVAKDSATSSDDSENLLQRHG